MSHAKSRTPAGVELATDDGRLKVEFYWQRDRFVHRVYVDNVEAGHSVDGDGEMDWPPSPPIQQLSLENFGDAPVILGVGGAGRGHWSISVELSDSEGIGTPAIKFDLACRSKDAAMSLGSSYQLNNNVRLLVIDGSVEESDAEGVRVVPSELDRGTPQWSYKLGLP